MKRELAFLFLVGIFLASSVDAMRFRHGLELQEKEVQLARKKFGRFVYFDPSELNELADGGEDEKRCWLRSYGRGVGRPLSECPVDTEKSGLLCYPPCKAGYTGVSFVCWQNCPDGFNDVGVTCGKSGTYVRAAFGNRESCNSHNPDTGCAPDFHDGSMMFYANCKPGFYASGGVCSPNCPDDMTDAGVACTKASYTRTAGVPMICKSNEQENVGLCYDLCNDGYNGIGPVCWGACPAGYNQCGAMCLESSHCTEYLLEFLQPIMDVVEAAVEREAAGVVEGVADIVTNLIYPICGE